MLQKIKSNQKPSICSSCKGACCKNIPGICHPLDMKIDKEILRELLNGDYIFDFYEGTKQYYYLRPKTVNEAGKWFNGSWGASCSLLTPTGCPLKFKDRPHQCRSLIPKSDFNCKSDGLSKKDYGKLWMQHHGKIILELRDEDFKKRVI